MSNKNRNVSHRARVRDGLRWTEYYPVAKTTWDVYSTHVHTPDEYGYIPPELVIWLSAMTALLARRPISPQHCEVRFIANVRVKSGGGFQMLTRFVQVPATLRELQTLTVSTEAQRRAVGGRKIDAHAEALGTYEALIGRLRAQGLTDRAARGHAQRIMADALGFRDTRSVRNLLQPGARRGMSTTSKARLDALFEGLGRPSAEPRIPPYRNIATGELYVRMLTATIRWVEGLARFGYDTFTWTETQLRGVHV